MFLFGLVAVVTRMLGRPAPCPSSAARSVVRSIATRLNGIPALQRNQSPAQRLLFLPGRRYIAQQAGDANDNSSAVAKEHNSKFDRQPVSAAVERLLPAAQRAGGRAASKRPQFALDHGALAALLVPTPAPAIAAAIRTIQTAHNAVEEATRGVYEVCEQLVAAEADALLARLRAAPDVRMNPHVDSPLVRAATRRAVARAGFDPDVLQL